MILFHFPSVSFRHLIVPRYSISQPLLPPGNAFSVSYSILKDLSNPLIYFLKKITKRKLKIAHILHLSTNLVLNQQFSFKSNLLPLATSFSCPDPLYIKEITDKDQNIERLLNGMNCIAVCIQTVIFWFMKFTQPT